MWPVARRPEFADIATLKGCDHAELSSLEELARSTGEELGASQWHTVTQSGIDRFAESTGDLQSVLDLREGGVR